jgi:hypothetical protein
VLVLVVGGIVELVVLVLVVDAIVELVLVVVVVGGIVLVLVATVGTGGVLATVAVAHPVRRSTMATETSRIGPEPGVEPCDMMGRTLLIQVGRRTSPGRRLDDCFITIR